MLSITCGFSLIYAQTGCDANLISEHMLRKVFFFLQHMFLRGQDEGVGLLGMHEPSGVFTYEAGDKNVAA